MKRGEVWIASLEPNRGAEVGKQRPVLIIQSDLLNDIGHPTVVILPISSQEQPENLLRVKIENPALHHGIGYILIDQIRSVDAQSRLKNKIASLSETELKKISILLGICLEFG